jgi:hypothetical protein
MVIDLATGFRLPLNESGPGSVAVDIDYDNGALSFNRDTMITIAGSEYRLAGRNVRVLYRADGDWSLQLQKAYELYRRDIGTRYGTNTPASVDYRTYTAHSTDGVLTGVLSFAPCDAGKTVSIDYAYMDANNIEHKVVGECHQISEAETTLGGAGIPACNITLDFKDTQKFGVDAAGNKMTRIYNVVGVSLKVRVLWREGKRWRYVDKDTTLMRKSPEV